MIWSVNFWKGAAERAVKSFFQGIATAITADAVVSLWDLDVQGVAGVGGLMALFSLITSIGSPEFVAGKDDAPTI